MSGLTFVTFVQLLALSSFISIWYAVSGELPSFLLGCHDNVTDVLLMSENSIGPCGADGFSLKINHINYEYESELYTIAYCCVKQNYKRLQSIFKKYIYLR